MNAEDKFCMIEEATPELLEKATQNDLARYLVIKPAGLYRIKKRTYENRV